MAGARFDIGLADVAHIDIPGCFHVAGVDIDADNFQRIACTQIVKPVFGAFRDVVKVTAPNFGAVGAGTGDLVLYATGSSARQTELTKDKPCDAVTMAIVDSWDLGGENVYEKWA